MQSSNHRLFGKPMKQKNHYFVYSSNALLLPKLVMYCISNSFKQPPLLYRFIILVCDVLHCKSAMFLTFHCSARYCILFTTAAQWTFLHSVIYSRQLLQHRNQCRLISRCFTIPTLQMHRTTTDCMLLAIQCTQWYTADVNVFLIF